MKGILLILVLALGSFLGLAFGQTSGFHVLANTIGDAATSITSNSWMPGIKKILGGIQVSVFNHRIVRANLTMWAFMVWLDYDTNDNLCTICLSFVLFLSENCHL